MAGLCTNCEETKMRDQYGALISWPDFTKDLATRLEKAGAWETGISSDRRGLGVAINLDLYGYDVEQGLAVFQVRQAIFHPSRPTRVRKNYFLCGTTETGSPFAHPVDSPARSKRALASPQACVKYVLAKIWQCSEDTLSDIERQGDVAFVPVKDVPKTAEEIEGPVMLRDSHEVRGRLFRDWDGTLYTVRGARLLHKKGQHAAVKARGGFYRIQEGVRVPTWSFSMQVGD
ncbi:MAG: hypothetical protein EOM25_12375 [Deltaproteobacteria bacterium]|nr:hypothetical protein [Deltaproteobacteria bacterium]